MCVQFHRICYRGSRTCAEHLHVVLFSMVSQSFVIPSANLVGVVNRVHKDISIITIICVLVWCMLVYLVKFSAVESEVKIKLRCSGVSSCLHALMVIEHIMCRTYVLYVCLCTCVQHALEHVYLQ